MATEDNEDANLLQETLKDILDPDHGLLDKLKYKNVLNRSEVLEIEAERTYMKRSSKLLEYISRKSKHAEFLFALRESSQSHIANYIEANGCYRQMHGVDWPLKDHQKSILHANEEILADLIELDIGLLDSLYSKGAINERQRQTISSKHTKFKKNQTLLDIIRRRSIGDYRKMITCLHSTNQSHIAEILEEGGAVVGIHSMIGVNDELTEDEVIDSFVQILENREFEASRRILEGSLKIIALKKSKSINVYILCENLEQLRRLKEAFLNGDLQVEVRRFFSRMLNRGIQAQVTIDTIYSNVESVFKYLYYESQLKDVFVNVSESEIDRCQSYFSERDAFNSPNTKVTTLPNELLDTIVAKSYLLLAFNECRIQLNEEIVKRLAYVSSSWFHSVKGKILKKIVWSYFENNQMSNNAKRAVIRNNRQLFQENFVDTQSTNSVVHDNFQRFLKGKAIFSIQRNFKSASGVYHPRSLQEMNDEMEIDSFVRSNKRKRKKLFNKILKCGGVAVRVEILYSRVQNKTERVEKFVKLFKSQADSELSISPAQEKVLCQLKQLGIEIMNVTEDRDIVVWVLCKSPSTMEQLNQLIDSNGLQNMIHQITEGIPELMKPRRLNIDCDQLKKEFAEVSLTSATFEGVVPVQGGLVSIKGIAKLKNKIYILRRIRIQHCEFAETEYDDLIGVFEDQHPFSLQKEISLGENQDSLDIESSERNNCLFILIDSFSCVFKIEQKKELEYDTSKWLQFQNDFHPQIMSSSVDGQLLMANSLSPVDLRIYMQTSNDKIFTSVQLTEEINFLRRIVKTSIGTFICLHTLQSATNENRTGKEMDNWTVSELSRDGKTVIRRFHSQNYEQLLSIRLFSDELYLCIDSEARVLVADTYKHRVVILNQFLQWERILIPTRPNKRQLESIMDPGYPTGLFYDEEKDELILGEFKGVKVYSVQRQCSFAKSKRTIQLQE